MLPLVIVVSVVIILPLVWALKNKPAWWSLPGPVLGLL